LIVVFADSLLWPPANDLTSLIAWLKANSDKAMAGTCGVGCANHVFGAFFQIVEEDEKYGRLVKELNIKAE
jgi:hypothetical protein